MIEHQYKIVYCIPAIYSVGGVERITCLKASFLADYFGYDVTIIVTDGKDNKSFFPLSKKVKVKNLELNYEELWSLSFPKKYMSYIIKQHRFKKELTSELMRIRPDFTISTLRREINFLNEIKDGSKKIGELHVNRANYRNFNERNSSLFKWLFARFWMRSLICHLRKLDKMVVLTDAALKEWPELNNVIKISNSLPFNLDELSSLSHKRIISIGHYAYDKGNDMLLRVWALIEKGFPGWTLDIYGNGNREPYRKMLKELGIDKQRCYLNGPTSDVKKEYLSSSVFVLPSRFEGFGLVIIESMACGVPVVAFDCENGPRSIITDGENGFLIPTFDIEAFAEKVMLLMKDRELRLRMGENAYRTAAKYDIDRIGLQWKQLFDELKGQ